MIPQSHDVLDTCRLCGRIAHHSIADERLKKSHLCCYHYQKLFLQRNEYCTHNEYPEVTYECGKHGKYRVTVTYLILPEREWKMKQEAITRILVNS